MPSRSRNKKGKIFYLNSEQPAKYHDGTVVQVGDRMKRTHSSLVQRKGWIYEAIDNREVKKFPEYPFGLVRVNENGTYGQSLSGLPDGYGHWAAWVTRECTKI